MAWEDEEGCIVDRWRTQVEINGSQTGINYRQIAINRSIDTAICALQERINEQHKTISFLLMLHWFVLGLLLIAVGVAVLVFGL